MTNEQLALQQAVAHHNGGRLQDAEWLYRSVLQRQPDQPEANHNLGVLSLQKKRFAASLPYFKAALEANPQQAQYWLSYIDALVMSGQPEAARQLFEEGRQKGLQGPQVDALAARFAEADKVAVPTEAEKKHLISLFGQGRCAEAEKVARAMTQRFPDYGFGWKALGACQTQLGQLEAAIEAMRKSAALLPADAEAQYNLGVILKDMGHVSEAEASLRRALELKPDEVDALNNLGSILFEAGRTYEAEPCYRRALELRPNSAFAHNNLGLVFKDTDRFAEAEVSFRRALSFDPNYVEAHDNLGGALMDTGRMAEAEASYRRVLPLDPNYVEAHDNLLFMLNYSIGHDPASCLEDARNYGRMVNRKAAVVFSSWQVEPRPQRLRVGLVSGDLHSHPVGYFLEGLVANIDPARIELIAYPCQLKEDDLTARIKPSFAAWRSLSGKSDTAAAKLIHDDGVHVLIDLSGHTARNRLPVFAWKPAPVQVSWLGYFATTGVAEIDYLLADPWTLPVSEEAYFTEKIWRLPETRLCFTVPDEDVAVSPLPALTERRITFGCFNNLAKMNDSVVALWARVLAAVPDSRLFLMAKQFKEDIWRLSVTERFAAHGIAADRLVLEGSVNRAQYLASYGRVDIALDPFPYPGGTTSAEALWMGVPVLTLTGERFLSRQGVGLLMNAGLSEWIATDADDYVAKAVGHSANLDFLAETRAGLREKVVVSPLFDAPRFARHFEAAMWEMWRGRSTHPTLIAEAGGPTPALPTRVTQHWPLLKIPR